MTNNVLPYLERRKRNYKKHIHFYLVVHFLLHIELCLPPDSYIKDLTPGLQNVTLFGDKIFTEAVKLKWVNLNPI